MRLNKFAVNLIDMKDIYNKNTNPLIEESFIKFLDKIKSDGKIDENVYLTMLDENVSIIEFTSLLKDYPDFIKSKKEVISDMNKACNDIKELINLKTANFDIKENFNFIIVPDYEIEKFNITFDIIIPADFFYSYFNIEDKNIKESTLSKFYDMFFVLRLNKYLDIFFEKYNIKNKSHYIFTKIFKNEKENFERTLTINRDITLADYYNNKIKDLIVDEIIDVSYKMKKYFCSLNFV